MDLNSKWFYWMVVCVINLVMKNFTQPLHWVRYTFSLLFVVPSVFSWFIFNPSTKIVPTNIQDTISSNAGYTIYFPLLSSFKSQYIPQSSESRVNVPYFSDDIRSSTTAIFWFGHVNLSDNYADGRVGYNQEELFIAISSFDRRLWYDKNPNSSDLPDWDAVSVYLDTSGNGGSFPSTASYKIVAQLNWWETREAWQIVYRGNGVTWDIADVQVTTTSGWRGTAPNDDLDDKGWWMIFRIPFASLGFTEPPEYGEIWEFAAELYDRDDADGVVEISDKRWPAGFDENQPETWNELRFGLPVFSPPPLNQAGETIIKHSNDIGVYDAHIGGHTTCGEDGTIYFDLWGDMNYAGFEQINIQNQTDISDWPCFSKFYITFPLDSVPSGKVILSATLTMYQFGNSGQSWVPGPSPSLIQVLTIGNYWDEGTITWNNAPLAIENISQAWVDPLTDPNVPWPGIPRDWDVSLAVASAYTLGEPLRLALYSADSAIHSGKYFYSSDAGEAAQPNLTIQWGNP